VLLIRGYRPPPSWPIAVLLGLLEPALAYLGDTFGLSLTSAADGAIISGLESALVIILAALVLGEAVSRTSMPCYPSGSAPGSGYPSSVPSNARHTSMMSTTPSMPVSPATGR